MNLRGFCRFWGGGRRRRALTAVALLAALVIVANGTRRVLWDHSSEFMGYRHIVQVSVMQRGDPYRDIEHVRAYPPFFGIFWLPFGALPVGEPDGEDAVVRDASTAQRAQLGVSVAAYLSLMTALTFLSAWWIARAGREPDEGERPLCALALIWLLAGGLMLNGVVRAETDMLIVGLVAGAMYLMFRRGRDGWAGALLGVAAAVKLTPALFGVYLLCRRRWRALGGMIAAGLVCTVILPVLVWGPSRTVELHRSWHAHVLAPYAGNDPAFIGRPWRGANQSPKAMLMRYLTHYNAGRSEKPRYVDVADLPQATVNAIATALKLVVLLALVAAWAWPPVRREGDLGPVLFALVPLGMLTISDVAHGSMLSVLIVPMGVLVGFCFGRAGTAPAGSAARGLMSGFLLLTLIGVRRMKEFSCGTFGVFLLLGLLLWLAVRLRREAAATGMQIAEGDTVAGLAEEDRELFRGILLPIWKGVPKSWLR